ncbi:type IV secretion system protein VirB10 [Paraburkholderia sartisoli]|uniref:Type IV secretion system protein VirB10 n=1 Tax=Paraburkholderia sartisoli TaxID=83784 RepID=A0A1H4CHX6_9BURK|nr:type IV secretion system protein VirB10 [Paraburkholderia sartisoli]SEA59930.1 type IV secretion system protein VirB10 [Paraburkholderia sartisoli]
MSDDTPRNLIGPDGPPGRDRIPDNPDNAEGPDRALPGRDMPELGQHGGGRPRAWWLTPLAIVALVVVGAVWTVHGFLARHDAAARARRDAALDQPVQGRIFGDEPALAAGMPVSVAHPASAPVGQGTPASAAAPTRSPVNSARVPAVRSYYDAPLLATGGPGSSGTQDGAMAGAPQGGAGTPAPAFASGSVATPNADRGQAGSPLGQALTPTLTPRVTAGLLGNRSLILAQGAKIDCVGDTAFDSTEAGISTCTVTRNVYSDDGRVVLIERGSQINSEYRSRLSPGQTRVFVLSARIRTPHGVTAEIDSPAADALGRIGVGGYVNNHWGERIGAAMLLGMTRDAIGYLATRGGNSNGSVVFESTQQQGNDMATRVLDSTINIPPTLTQSQGAEFTIIVARDLDFSTVYALQPEALR